MSATAGSSGTSPSVSKRVSRLRKNDSGGRRSASSVSRWLAVSEVARLTVVSVTACRRKWCTRRQTPSASTALRTRASFQRRIPGRTTSISSRSAVTRFLNSGFVAEVIVRCERFLVDAGLRRVPVNPGRAQLLHHQGAVHVAIERSLAARGILQGMVGHAGPEERAVQALVVVEDLVDGIPSEDLQERAVRLQNRSRCWTR